MPFHTLSAYKLLMHLLRPTSNVTFPKKLHNYPLTPAVFITASLASLGSHSIKTVLLSQHLLHHMSFKL